MVQYDTLSSSAGVNNTVVLTTNQLKIGTIYYVTMGSGVSDIAGSTIANPYSFKFKTVGTKAVIGTDITTFGVNTLIKSDTFEQSATLQTASATNPLWANQFSFNATGNIVSTTDENSIATNALQLYETSYSTNTVYVYKKQAYETVPANDAVFEVKFKLKSDTVGGTLAWYLNYADGSQWNIFSLTSTTTDSVLHTALKIFSNEGPTAPVLTDVILPEVWYTLQVRLNTTNVYDKKCIGAYLNGTPILATMNKSLSYIKQINNTDATKTLSATSFVANGITAGVNRVYLDNIRIFEPELNLTDVVLNDFALKDNRHVGAELHKISDASGGKLIATAQILNNEIKAGKNATAVMALYASDDVLVNVAIIPCVLEKGCSKTVTAEFDIPAVTTNGWKASCYVLESLDTIKPICANGVLLDSPAKTYGLDVYNDTTKPLTVVFLGGSITEGENYSTPLVNNFFRANGREVKVVVGGVGGTGSQLGLFRMQNDIISSKPDIVFVEFAVNDALTPEETVKTSMEGIVKQLEALPHQPVVMFLYSAYTSAPYAGGAEKQQKVADYYGIGSVKFSEYVNDLFSKTPLFTVSSWLPDGVHPNAIGGKAYSDFIIKQFKTSPATYFKNIDVKATQLTSYQYNKPDMISYQLGTYNGSWTQNNTIRTKHFLEGTKVSTTPGDTVTLNFKGRSIGIYSWRSTTGASASYSIDNGAYTGTIDTYQDVAGMPAASFFRNDLTDANHTIAITVNAINPTYPTRNTFEFAYFLVDEGVSQ